MRLDREDVQTEYISGDATSTRPTASPDTATSQDTHDKKQAIAHESDATSQVESERYGERKPKRVVVRARIADGNAS